MADRKITALTELTAPVAADVFPIIDVSESANANKNKYMDKFPKNKQAPQKRQIPDFVTTKAIKA